MLIDLVCAYLRIPLLAHPGKAPSAFLMALVSLSVRWVHGPTKIDVEADEVIVVCRVKNGEEYVTSFIDHHLSLGAEHIVLLDNDSSDKTISLACRHENVTVLRTPLPYRTYSRLFNAYLRKRYSRSCWCLCLDVDELFDYPYSDKMSLKELLRYLNDRSYTVVLANMLEMFADEPFSSLEGNMDNRDYKELYRYFDLGGILSKPVRPQFATGSDPGLRLHMGGIRKTGFGKGGPLLKFPLVFLNPDLSYKDFGNHHILGGSPSIADFSCVLYHYQFTGSLRERCNQAVRQNQYSRRSAKYRAFLEVLSAEPNLNLREKALQPRELEATNELIDAGFLYVSDEFAQYAEGCCGV
jgi:hypothetical protein